MEEQLKERVLARATDIWKAQLAGDFAPQDSLKPYRLWMSFSGNSFEVQSPTTTVRYWFGNGIPASDPVWKLVAPILGIETIDPPLA